MILIDILIGGTGNNYLNGGAGKDIYVFNKGDGNDIIDDTPQDARHQDASVLVLGEGLKREDVKFRAGLTVDFGTADPAHPDAKRDTISFAGFDQLNPQASPLIGELRFFDGQIMTYADILAQGFDIDGIVVDNCAAVNDSTWRMAA